MNRFLSWALILGAFSLTTVGCAEKATETKETKVSTPGGTTVTVEREVTQTGDVAPAK